MELVLDSDALLAEEAVRDAGKVSKDDCRGSTAEGGATVVLDAEVGAGG